MPVLPASNVSLVGGVSIVAAPGCTTLLVQARSRNHLVAATDSGVDIAGLYFPSACLAMKSPPAAQRKFEKYQDAYPRLVEPGTASPNVSFLPLPSGSCVVNALASATNWSRVFGTGNPVFCRQSLRISNALACAEYGTP